MIPHGANNNQNNFRFVAPRLTRGLAPLSRFAHWSGQMAKARVKHGPTFGFEVSSWF